MKENFIPYEQSLALEELGFDKQCLGYYIRRNSAFDVDDLLITTELINLFPFDSSSCKAPLWQQSFSFFREKGYRGEIKSYLVEELVFFINIETNQKSYSFNEDYKTFEEAQLECLKKLIGIACTTKK